VRGVPRLWRRECPQRARRTRNRRAAAARERFRVHRAPVVL